MKKILAFLMLVCVIVSTLFATAVSVSAEDSNTVVMTVSGMTENGSKILTEHYYNFESAWNDAARYAKDHEWMQQNGVVCIVVDLQADWVAEKGKFGKDNVGFKESTICIPENTKMMINMQGHTIDRGLTKAEDHGEVIFMGKNSTLIINGGYIKDDIVEVGKSELNKDKMGTITGGYSDSGAGGIHLDGYNDLVLNNVHVVGNGTKGERGAAIALFNDSTLTMNGGSLSNNCLEYADYYFTNYEPEGTLYLKNSTATLNNVELCNNYFKAVTALFGKGVAIYAIDSSVTMKKCLVAENSNELTEELAKVAKGSKGEVLAREVIYAKKSTLDITDTDFINNCSLPINTIIVGGTVYSFLFNLDNCEVYLTGGKITENSPELLFNIKKSHVEMRALTITDNASWTMYINNDESQKVKVINCTFNNNQCYEPNQNSLEYDIEVNKKNILEFDGGDLGDTVFKDKSMVASVGVGSIFGEGSFSMIVAILALIASGVAIFLIVDMKKKLVPAAVGDDSKTEDEE